jgi:hypothetical protein
MGESMNNPFRSGLAAGDVTVSLDIKKWFFDQPAVVAMLSAETRKNLLKWGRYARGAARKLPKRRTRASRPGETPTKWVPRRRPSSDPAPRKRGAASLDMVLFGFEPPWSVVFGPVGVGNSPTVPNRLQFGNAARRRNSRRKRRGLGHGAEIRLNGPKARTTRRVLETRNGHAWVTYIKLRTGPQVARANRLNAELYGPFLYGPIKPRPWVNLAVDAAVAKFGSVFSGSVAE